MISSYSGLTKNLAMKLKFQSKLIVHWKIFPSGNIKACVIFIRISICGSCNFFFVVIKYNVLSVQCVIIAI